MADEEKQEFKGPYGAKINFERESGISFQTFHEGQTKSTFNNYFSQSFLDDTNKSNQLTTTLGIMNTVMGAGTIALPFVLRQFGFILGVIMIFLIYLLTVLTCKYLLMAKNLSGLKDYKQLGFKLFKKPGEVFIKMIIIINNVGLNISYFIIFGDALKNVFTPFCKDSSTFYCNSFFYSKAFFVLCIAGLQFPLIFARHMAKIKVVSYISITGISIFCIGCISTFFIKVHKHSIPSMDWIPNSDTWNTKQALACFTDIFLAYTFHFNWFPLYRSLEKPSNKRMMTCGQFGLGGCCTIYLLVAMAGVAAYGTKVDINFINCFEVSDIGKPLYIIINLGYAACCCSSLPFFFFEGRNYLLSLYGDIEGLIVKKKISTEEQPLNQDNLIENTEYNQADELEKDLKKEEDDPKLETGKINIDETNKIKHIDKERSLTFFLIFSVCLYGSIVIVGIFLNDLGIVFGIISSVCANCVAYIFPATFYLKLTKKRTMYFKVAMGVLIFGLCSGVVCFVANMLQL